MSTDREGDRRRRSAEELFRHRQMAVKNEVTSSDFTGQTYKLILLPLWVGAYNYRGQTFRVLVNGQTGKVFGDKPKDPVKVALALVAGAAALLLVLLIGYFIFNGLGWL